MIPPMSAASPLQIPPTVRGLTESEVQQKRAEGLGNPPPPPTSRTYVQIVRENVFTFINGVIFFLGTALFLVGRPSDAIVSVGIISLNILVSVVQEIRAKRTLDAIALLTRPKATVIREGQPNQVAPEELVVGDVLYVAPGDQIVLDGKVIEGKMAVDESQLTGESNSVAKQNGDEVYSGSFCVNGSAFYVAEKVGMASLANQITAGAKQFRRILTPLQQEVVLVVRIMLLVVVYLEILVVLNALLKSINLGDTVQHSTLIAGLVPNGLFLSISIAYALGAVRIIRFGVLVQQANAIESLSNVNVLCLDKTGTLTTNRLQVNALHPLEISEQELANILGDMTTNATTQNKTSEALAEKFQGAKRTVTGEIPFSSARKWSAIAFSDEGKGLRTESQSGSTQSSVLSTRHSGTFALGAPEMLQPYLSNADEMDESSAWREIVMQMHDLAEQGLRVLLVAYHSSTELKDEEDDSRLPQNMTPLGLVSIRDELRGEAREALNNFINAGVKPKIISGDNAETVAALAKQAGLQNAKLVSGVDLEKMNDAQFREAAREATIFGRITPQQKQRLVEALRADGHYVAMIGDGVNDVLSLKQANLGIAMQSGTQATRAVADLVLMQDSFAALAPAVTEGQRIVNGMQDILKLFLTRIATMAMVILSALVIGEFPLELRQGSLVTLFSVGIPTVMLALWARPGAIGRGTLPQRLFHFIFTPVLVTTILALFLFYGTLVGELMLRVGSTNLTQEAILPFYPVALFTAQSTLVAFLVLVGLLTVIFVEPPTEWWTGGDELGSDWKPTLLAVALVFVFLIILFVKPLRDVFAMAELGAVELLVAVTCATIWLFLVRWLWRRRVFAKYLGVREVI
jgi:cation-transporting P-type ATPase E